MLKARHAVRNLKEYHPPLGNREGLRLDFNENTVGCSPKVLEKLRRLDYEALARYPEREPAEAIVAKHLSVEPAELLLTNGTDEAIHLICETYLEPHDEVLIVVPTFAMFEIYAATTGAQIISIPAGKGFQFPLEEVLSRISARTRMIAWANPNNPTGTLVPAADLMKVAKAAPQAALLVDEAYYHFCGETMVGLAREQENLFVTRTFSKAYGLAGLRIGVITGHREQMAMLRRNSSPYNLNIAALACLPNALADQQYIDDYVNQVIQGRTALEAELKSRGIRYWPSRANFVLFYLGESNKPFIAAMRDHGILVRDRSKDPGCAGCVRITLGGREHNQRLMQALNQVFAKLPQPEKVAQ
jgi:histidinol-phosphate aminotransferase